MSNLLITQIVVALAIVGSVGVFFGWIAIPAIKARQGTWDRVAAGLLSVYAFAVFAALGVGVGLGVLLLLPRIT